MSTTFPLRLELDAATKVALLAIVALLVVILLQMRRGVRVEVSLPRLLGLSVAGAVPVALAMACPVRLDLRAPVAEREPQVKRPRAGFTGEPFETA
jgi:hypothetical protein